MKLGFDDLDRIVIRRGLCTGCGTCAGICPTGGVEIAYEDGEPVPVLRGDCINCEDCYYVCPGEDVPLPALEKRVFGRMRTPSPYDLGVYKSCVSVCASDEVIQRAGASGGLVTGLLAYALEAGVIDCAVVAGFRSDRPWLPEARLAATRAEIIDAAQSKYTTVPINAILREAVERGYRRIGVAGVPCHIEAIRKMQIRGRPARIAQSITLTIGLFCATEFYLEGVRHLLAEWCGVPDITRVRRLQYRGGAWPGHLVVDREDGTQVSIDRHRYVYHFMIPMWKRDRCEMCVDWTAELADLSVGDYWSPQMKPGEELGHSTCIIRSDAGAELMAKALKDGAIKVDGELDPRTVTSGAGFEIKKHAAAFRLRQRQKFGWPTPRFHLRSEHEPVHREFHIAPETKK